MSIFIIFFGCVGFWVGVLFVLAVLEVMPTFYISGNFGKKLSFAGRFWAGCKNLVKGNI